MKHRQGTSLIAIAAVSFIIISSLLCGCADLDGICEPTEPLPVQTPLPSPSQTALGSKTVVIDAGHGGQDGGAVGRITGVKEDGINLSVALLLKDKLEQLGFTVIMTRTSDSALADAKKDDMKMRRDIMNQDGVSIVVSIHMNKFSDTSIKGPMAFYMKGSAEGERLATSIICALCDALGNPRRLANPGDYFVIRESVPPAVIVECGFLSNADDEKLLQTAEHQSKLVEGIAAGITAYFGGGE